jgi:hypothetical protein
MAPMREAHEMASLPPGLQRDWGLAKTIYNEVARITEGWVLHKKEIRITV